MSLIKWEDVVTRYGDMAAKADATQANSAFVGPAIAELESRLSQRFTVPFSSNNVTAIDLAIDMAYAKFWRFKDPEKAAMVDSYVGKRIDGLAAGATSMVTASSGTATDANIGDLIWSPTKAYTPIFGLSPTEMMQVDSGQIINEEGTRGHF